MGLMLGLTQLSPVMDCGRINFEHLKTDSNETLITSKTANRFRTKKLDVMIKNRIHTHQHNVTPDKP